MRLALVTLWQRPRGQGAELLGQYPLSQLLLFSRQAEGGDGALDHAGNHLGLGLLDPDLALDVASLDQGLQEAGRPVHSSLIHEDFGLDRWGVLRIEVLQLIEGVDSGT